MNEKNNILNLANFLSITRMLSDIPLIYFLSKINYENYVLYSRLEASEARISENPWILQNSRKINCLLQVHIAEEQNKYGFNISQVEEIVSKIYTFQNIHVI